MLFFAGLVLSGPVYKITAADTIGLEALRSAAPPLDGLGVHVAQPEGIEAENSARWQPNPSLARSGVHFSFTSTNGTATHFPNQMGNESSHANAVAARFYGANAGVAPGVTAVDCYEADYFYQSIVAPLTPIPARIINQSFIFQTAITNEQVAVNREYDDYADRFNVLFVNGLGNGGIPYPAATAYNGIGVAAFGGASSVGPTIDHQRSKPDLTAPAGVTSFSTPLVAGAAALLLQAALRGDGGDTNAADVRVLKALLLNGAVKPADWVAPVNQPLDTRYGSGVLNVFNSWNQLRSGRITRQETTSVTGAAAHPPGSVSESVTNRAGWIFASITNNAAEDTVQHHYIDLPVGPTSYGATLTLVWNKQEGRSALNDLDLHLLDAVSGESMGQSTTFVNNVEHLHLTRLAPGRYDLQVLKNFGTPSTGRVSASETYAVAFEFYSVDLDVQPGTGSVHLSWPLAPDGFQLESAADLPGPWMPVNASPVIIGNQKTVDLVSTNTQQFYRLRRP